MKHFYSISNVERAAEIAQGASANSLQGSKDSKRPLPGLSIVVLNLNKPEYIVPLLKQLKEQEAAFLAGGASFEFIVGDTGSTDEKVLAAYRDLPSCGRVVSGLTYHFSRCNNQIAFGEAKFDTFLFLNNDIILPDRPTALWELYSHLSHHQQGDEPPVGALGTYLYFADGTIQHAGIELSRTPEIYGFCYHPFARQRLEIAALPQRLEVPAVTGAFLMMSAQLYSRIGGMDPLYAAECQDVALCLAAQRLGYRSELLNVGPVIHLENGTRTRGEENWPDRKRFMRKWSSFIEARFL
ncbi:hypothetical protein WDW86_04605 [Bdellovibrionota bacterium FG-2]